MAVQFHKSVSKKYICEIENVLNQRFLWLLIFTNPCQRNIFVKFLNVQLL